jgi:2-methylisocitrate lyase-like PEP mutase family enzyme
MTTNDTWSSRRDRFRALHRDGLFVMPNPMDAGSARLLASMGFPALATTSSGFAATLGRLDYGVQRDELLEHVAALAAAVDVPLNVDSERCFADDPAGVAETVELLADAGASGCSIEDFDPATGAIDPLEVAVPRVAAAARAARGRGVVLTARAENHLHGVDDLDETITRLKAYRDAGAEVVFAPGLTDPEQIRRLVQAVELPVNVIASPKGPSVPALAALGVRRVSTGGSLARAAYGAIASAAAELQGPGTSTYLDGVLTWADFGAAMAKP